MRFEKKLGLAAMLLAGIGPLGCAPTLPKMQPDRAVEIERGFLGASYKQDGHPIDLNDMQEQISRDPEAGSYVSKSRTLGVISTVLAAAGGAMIGWPIGQKIGGHEDPKWELAYIGAGVAAISIPIGIWGASSLNSAVEAFNQHLPRPTEAQPAPK